MNDELLPNERLIHAALEERLGDLAPPDVTQRVLDSTPERRAATLARTRAAEASRRWTRGRIGSLPWLAAAVLVLGIGVAFWIGHSSGGDGRDPDSAALGNSDRQDPDDKTLRPRSLAELRQLLATVRKITFETLRSEAGDDRGRGEVAITDAASVRTITAALRASPRAKDLAGWIRTNRISFHLPNGRYIVMSISDRWLDVHELLALHASAEVQQLLAPHLERSDFLARRSLGIVESGDELRETGADAFPADIESLTLYNLIDADLRDLQRFESVESIEVRGDKIGDVGLTHLGAITSLEQIRFVYPKFSDEGLIQLARLPRLRKLEIKSAGTREGIPWERPLTGTGFTAFADHEALRHVDLSWSSTLSDAGIRALARVPNLEWLDLSGRMIGTVTSRGLTELRHASELRYLDLGHSHLLLDEVIEALALTPALTELRLNDTRTTDAGIAALTHHDRRLQVLNLDRCKQIGDAALRTIGTLQELRNLSLAQCHAVTSTGLAQLATCRNLIELDINNLRLFREGTVTLPRFPNLERLDASFTKADDAALRSILKSPKLRALRLGGNHGITDAGLRALAQRTDLTELNLNVCDGFTAEGVALLRAALPDTEIVWPSEFRQR